MVSYNCEIKQDVHVCMQILIFWKYKMSEADCKHNWVGELGDNN